MALKNSAERYGSISMAFHWLMLVLIVAVYACMEIKDFYPKGSETREFIKHLHFMLGLTVFFLVWLRLINRWLNPIPRIIPPLVSWQARLSRIVHVALYFVMILAPLLGWMILSAAGKPIPFWGFELPPLMPAKPEIAKAFKARHELIANLGYLLITVHAGAALFHHYVVRDNTLLRMLPSRQ